MNRIIAQAAIAAVQIVTKAFMQAYQRAQAGGGAQGAASAMRSAVAGARMPLDQARATLNLEKGFTAADVEAQFQRYYTANDPDAGGSFYVQSKVVSARDVLLDDLRRNAKTSAEGGGEKPMQ